MKLFYMSIVAFLLFGYAGFSQELTFPRSLTNNGSVLTIYEPQVESWKDYKKLVYRMSFSLVPNQQKEVLGVLYMTSDTNSNTQDHTVFLSNIVITKVMFPSLDATTASTMDDLVKSFLESNKEMTVSLDQIVAFTPKTEPKSTVKVNNDPPLIFTSTTAAVLLQLEGKPVKAATGQENLDYVINSSMPLFQDKSNSKYYLYDGLEWQESLETNGPWAFTKTIPNSLTKLAKDTVWENLKGATPIAQKPNKKQPKIFFSESTAELILFEGKPTYKQITGTSLKFATNTDSDFIFSETTHLYYYLTSGRWFSASSLEGPWSYASEKLPADFLKIPANSVAASILAFVPGTDEAADAVLIAQIPTTTEVSPSSTTNLSVNYSGTPDFKKIEGTSLAYGVNTASKVIEVSSNEYYVCANGIWYNAATATGPWIVSTSIPAAIYEIPSNSPVYNLTYVTQSVNDSGVVVASYTAGYQGAYIINSGSSVVIVSGTGFYYPPFYYYPPLGFPVYYPYPCTYGPYAYCGFVAGMAIGMSFGYGYGYHYGYGYGGMAYHNSYNTATGAYGRSVTAYGPYGSATGAQRYNPSTGTYARGGSVSNGYGTRSAGQAYNPYTGASANTRQGSNPYGQAGTSTFNNGHGTAAQTAHVSTAQGNAAAGRTSNGNMLASANGNVYKNTGNGWEQGNNNNWNKQAGANAGSSNWNKPSGASGFNSQEMDNQARNSQRADTQSKQFQGRGGSSFGGGGGFGGSGGFGGRGGGGRFGGGRR